MHFRTVLILMLFVVQTSAQDTAAITLYPGDNAPSLQLRSWLKGDSIHAFEKNKIYIVEFWATWCTPCRAAMPRLSVLANKYRNKVTVIGIDVYEKSTLPLQKIQRFVDSMGNNMDYAVAAEDSNFMAANWLQASGENGIPSTFIINGGGKIEWIGHPAHIEEVLPKILAGEWDAAAASAKQKWAHEVRMLDDSLNFDVMNFGANWFKHDYRGKPDAALAFIKKELIKHPELQYAPCITFNTFSALIKTDQAKAYQFGKTVFETPGYAGIAYQSIIFAIQANAEHFAISPAIYLLGARACQLEINRVAYPEITNMPKRYYQMAEWYWLGNEKLRAIAAVERALELAKARANYPEKELLLIEYRLRKYKREFARTTVTRKLD